MAYRNLNALKKFQNIVLQVQATRVLTRCSSSSNPCRPEDQITHTGQKWDADDYRMVRFVGKTKVVNQNWAAKLIDEIPPESTKSRVVWCNGGGGPLGHPKVYINLDQPGNHSCGYCGLRFTKEGGHH